MLILLRQNVHSAIVQIKQLQRLIVYCHYLSHKNKNASLQDIIDHNLEKWSDTTIRCDSTNKKGENCGYLKRVKNSIETSNDILIVQLLIYEFRPDGVRRKIDNFQLQPFENEIINVSGKTYKVRNGIIHHGSDIESGHYTSFLRESNHWKIASDSSVSSCSQLQSLNVIYIIFLEKVVLSADTNNKNGNQIRNEYNNFHKDHVKPNFSQICPSTSKEIDYKAICTKDNIQINNNLADTITISKNCVPTDQHLPQEVILKTTDCKALNQKKYTSAHSNIQSAGQQDCIRRKRKLDALTDDCIHKKSKFEPAPMENQATKSHHEITWKTVGIENNDKDSFAISSLQSLFHCASIRSKFFNNPDKSLLQHAFRTYASGNRLSIMIVKVFAGHIFIQNKEQDAAYFIAQLILKSRNLQSSVFFCIITQINCESCENCKESIETNFILSLLLPENKKFASLQEIIDHNLDHWNDLNEICEMNCSNPLRMNRCIENMSDVLIVQLLICTDECDGHRQKVIDFHLASTEKNEIYISGEMYCIKSIIYHHDSDFWPIQSGHYTTILRGSSYWVIVEDLNIEPCSELQQRSGAYIIFLEKYISADEPKENQIALHYNDHDVTEENDPFNF